LDTLTLDRRAYGFRESVAGNGPQELKIIAQGEKFGYSCILPGPPRRSSGDQLDQQKTPCVKEGLQRGELNVLLHYAGNFSTNANQPSQ
jgi:hypothetical protein